MKSLSLWMRTQMIHSFEGTFRLIALPSVSVWAGNSEALARTASNLNTVSLEQSPCKESGEQFIYGFIAGGNYRRDLFSVRSLVWNGSNCLWKAGPTALKAMEKSYQPEFDSRGGQVLGSGLCVPGLWSWQGQSWGSSRQSGAQET